MQIYSRLLTAKCCENSWYKYSLDDDNVFLVVSSAAQKQTLRKQTEKHFSNRSCNCETHTHPFNSPFSGTTRVSRYQKGKTNLDFTEIVSGSGISWAICKSAPCSRQTITPAPHNSVFYRPDALPTTQPTVSKH